jgi:hypothetical protein
MRIDTDQPNAHCSIRQVFGKLLGISLNQFRDPDGTLTSFVSMLREDLIPEVSAYVAQAMRTPYDWTRRIWFQDGSGGDSIVLPNRAIVAVNVVFIRILPSLPWYRFSRFRNIDGTEFARAGFTEPPNTPAFQAPYNLGDSGVVPQYTGIEDADILVDTNARTIIIPPRALILTANAAVPFSSYSFIPGRQNVEIHYTFGYPPTTYESGAPLVFDETTGLVQPTNPTPPPNPYMPGTNYTDPIDYGSGIPKGLANSVARLVANRILRQNWRGISMGLASLNVDGASESYGSKPYSGDLDDDDNSIMESIISNYGISVLV